jgi:hypothetical protein
MPKYGKAKLAYLAGLIDGEGCIGTWQRNGYYYPKLTIGQIMPDIPVWVQFHFGENVRVEHRKGGRVIFLWRAGAPWIREILPLVVPYTVGKRAQAKLGIELANYPSKERRKEIAEELHQIKKIRIMPSSKVV